MTIILFQVEAMKWFKVAAVSGKIGIRAGHSRHPNNATMSSGQKVLYLVALLLIFKYYHVVEKIFAD